MGDVIYAVRLTLGLIKGRRGCGMRRRFTASAAMSAACFSCCAAIASPVNDYSTHHRCNKYSKAD